MKIQSLLMVSIICFFCNGVFAEEAATVTGICKDGTPYTGKSKRGACRGHDGVKEWYGEKGASAANTPSAAPAATPAPANAQSTPAPVAATPAADAKPKAAVTGICKDGTEYTGKSKRGACRGHDGVKEWFADKQAPAATAPVANEPAPVPPPVAPAPAAQTTQPAQAPATAAPAPKVPAPAAGSGQVWVNTHSKIYHCEGSKFYGTTKKGEYMSEADAKAKGFRANRNKTCN